MYKIIFKGAAFGNTIVAKRRGNIIKLDIGKKFY